MSDQIVNKTIFVESVTSRPAAGKTLWEVQERGGPKWSTFVPGIGNAAAAYEDGPALIEGKVRTVNKDGREFINYYLDSIKPSSTEPETPTAAASESREQMTKGDWRAKDIAADMRACIAIAAGSFDGLNSASPRDNIQNHALRVIALARHYFDAVQLAHEQAKPPEPKPEPVLSEKDEDIPF